MPLRSCCILSHMRLMACLDGHLSLQTCTRTIPCPMYDTNSPFLLRTGHPTLNVNSTQHTNPAKITKVPSHTRFLHKCAYPTQILWGTCESLTIEFFCFLHFGRTEQQQEPSHPQVQIIIFINRSLCKCKCARASVYVWLQTCTTGHNSSVYACIHIRTAPTQAYFHHKKIWHGHYSYAFEHRL